MRYINYLNIFITLSLYGCSVSEEIVRDIDGNEYSTVKIGNQIWMAENLRVTRFKNGDKIDMPPETEEYSLEGPINYDKGKKWYFDVWDQKPACLSYLNDKSEKFNPSEDGPDSRGSYGLLYNSKCINDDRGVAPDGYHVPTLEEYEVLIKYLGGYESTIESFWDGEVGPKLRSIKDWKAVSDSRTGVAYSTSGTNESGFNALPSGYKTGGAGPFGGIGESAHFWTATASQDSTEENWHMSFDYMTKVRLSSEGTGHGYSLRCIKNYEGMPIETNIQNRRNQKENETSKPLDEMSDKADTNGFLMKTEVDSNATSINKRYFNGCGYSYESKEDCMNQCGAFNGGNCLEGEATGIIIRTSSSDEKE